MGQILREVGFVHLHVHSSFSLLEGALPIATLAKLAEADGQPALALTDTNNLFGALEFSEKMASTGLQPIAGLQLSVLFEEPDPARPLALIPSNIVLLAQSEEGYRNLMRLSSRAFFDVDTNETPRIKADRLKDCSQGLICLTGGPSGPLDQAIGQRQPDLAQARLNVLKDLYPDRLYIELQRHNLPDERAIEALLLELADKNSLPIVATNEPYFAKRDDYEAHDALLAISDGRLISDDNRRRVTQDHGFKTRGEMKKLFADLPDAVKASVEIAMRCAFRVKTCKPILPRFTQGDTDEADELSRQARTGLEKRLTLHGTAPGLEQTAYFERLDFEISVISRMKYAGYFLIVSDFIKWAKDHDIPVGPGRGSGAGSLIAYALEITDLDPLRFGLLFERFLNPERVSMPDFDIDFCQDGRERVIQYVQSRYGAEQVAQIITFGTLQARGVMRDVGRVLEMSYGHVDKLTKLVPQNPANPVTLSQAIEGEPKLQAAAKDEPVVARMLGIARKLEGLHRHASTHAAGVVIGDRPLEELVPLYRDPKQGTRVTQYNMKWVEQAGLVKFDFLGLKTLTVLKGAIDLIAKKGIDVSLPSLPLDDPRTYEMLRRGETVGVFQLESVGMRKALVEMCADRFEDLIALVALYRPGPMANIPTYCARKNGHEEPEYLHPQLEPILTETHGIIVYQEQVMQAAQILAGYSLGDADLLRRAMGKKIKSEMDAQRDRFVRGAVERGLSDKLSNEIFDLLAKFADYGFNKSHAAAYALIAYQTAYLKANHPVEFLAASMILDMDNTDKLSEFRREAQRLGIQVDAPSINASGALFEVHGTVIRYALASIKGVGLQAVEGIVQARESEGPFKNISDFARRINPKGLNKRTLECLIAAGAFDEIDADRARVFSCIDQILGVAQSMRAAQQDGIQDMFGSSEQAPLRVPPYAPWTESERLQREYDAVGFFLSGHPLDEYGSSLKRLRTQTWAAFVKAVKEGASVGQIAATILDRMERRTKSGSKMGIVTLSDQTGHFEAIIFSEGLQHYRDILEPGRAVLVTVQAGIEGDEVRARIQTVEKLDDAVARHQKLMRVFLSDNKSLPQVAEKLKQGGDGEVAFIITLEDSSEVEIKLPGRYPASQQVAGALKVLPGVLQVELC